MPINRIPIEIITGFLGSGKTTFINELIRNKTVRNAIILVNDFGVVNIDATLIEYQDDKIKRLTNGCMCCSLNGSLAEQIHACLTLSDTPPTAIYIETSGVSKLATIFNVINISQEFVLYRATCLVDASAIIKNQSNEFTSDIWYEQIKLATHIHLNRLPKEVEKIRKFMSNINPDAFIELGSQQTTLTNGTPLLPGKLVSQTIRANIAIEQTELKDLFNQHKDCLIRAKGIINTYQANSANTIKVVVQFSADKLTFTPTALPLSRTNLVVIGVESNQFNDLCDKLKKLSVHH